MKAKTKVFEVDYYIWDGNSDGLQIWMNEFKERISNNFDLNMYDEEDELFIDEIQISKGDVIIRSSANNYIVMDEDLFKENYIVI